MKPDDSRTQRECHDLYRIAHKVDDPSGRESTPRAFKLWLTIAWEEEPREVWTVRAGDGTLTGYYRLVFPDKENLHHAYLEISVHPAMRRRGTGRELLAHATERAGLQGRTLLAGSAWQGTAGDAFARAVRAKPALAGIRRVQVLADINRETLDGLRDQARAASAGYSLVSWREPTPAEYIEPMVAVLTGFEDAPRSENTERAAWDVQRIRDDIARFPKFRQRGYAVAARHDATGALTAASTVYVDPDDAEWGFQGITAVVREHRGHRLGLLTKIAMLDFLAEAEPQLTHIETWNHEVNSYMIAVNEALGYQQQGPPNQEWELEI